VANLKVPAYGHVYADSGDETYIQDFPEEPVFAAQQDATPQQDSNTVLCRGSNQERIQDTHFAHQYQEYANQYV